MKRVGLAVLIVLGLLAAGGWALHRSGGLSIFGLDGAPDCTAERPCRLTVAFAYTREGAAAMRPQHALERKGLETCLAAGGDPSYCLLSKVAQEDVAALREAFRRSGLLTDAAGRRFVEIAPAMVVVEPIDGGSEMRIDIRSNHGAPAEFNRSLMAWLPDARRLRSLAKDADVVVVFSGMRGPEGECYADSLASRGYAILPGCTLRGYAAPQVTWEHRLMALHEIGHLFGAFHNDAGWPQPCRDAARSGHDPTACAWEQCKGRVCSQQELRYARDAFCTLAGQYNFNAGPTGDSYCRAHTGGENGRGWILEYSHPGKCRTPGFEAYDCGDAGHNAVATMRRRIPVVAARSPGRW